MDILETIIVAKRTEVARQKEAVSSEMLLKSEQLLRRPRSLSQALAESSTGIIAEFKRRSPSKGNIHPQAQVEEIVPLYEQSGASAISILTDEPFFGGSPTDFCRARKLVTCPLLRKEFIIDEYQILQSREMGADAILLIAAALTREACSRFVRLAHELSLEVLLEIHAEPELEYLSCGADMVGVNNRNLGTFVTEVENSFRLAEQLPADTVRVSESGISSPETVVRLRQAGYRGFLMGENFMKEPNPGAALQRFISNLNQSRP